ncbi:MAG: hypothetical protein M3071_11885 [Actinomycetota bacterium]|nr:hypothetical protein [Actinomycetota bacterium]
MSVTNPTLKPLLLGEVLLVVLAAAAALLVVLLLVLLPHAASVRDSAPIASATRPCALILPLM